MKIATSVVAAALLLSAVPFGAYAQQGGPAGQGGPGGPGGMRREITPEEFPAFKADVLKRLDERKARMEQERACVEKSTSMDEMRKCRPEPPQGGPMRRGGGMMDERMPMQQNPGGR